MIHALIVILIVAGLMQAARSFLTPGAVLEPFTGTTLGFGFLLLTAFFAGKAFAAARLPRLTGYIFAGVIAGPSLVGLVSHDMVRTLGPVQGVAICLIALAAGGELNLRVLRPLLGTIVSMTLWVVIGSALACALASFALAPYMPFLSGLHVVERALVSAVLGVSLAAMSPAVVMALLSEMQAEGRLSRVMLGVVVAADLAVIVLFAIVASIAQAKLGGSADITQAALHLGWELFGSALVGAVIGALVAFYLRKVASGRALFVLLVCVVISEIGARLALDPLIVALSAGLFMENVAEVETSKLLVEIETASLPIYVVFFAVAGAALRVDLLARVALPAAALVVVRFAAVYLSSRIAAKQSRAEPKVARWAFSAFLPQAGLALALPLLYPKVLGPIAEGAATLVLGIVGINQLAMPLLLRLALVRSGEAGKHVVPEASAALQEAPAEDSLH